MLLTINYKPSQFVTDAAIATSFPDRLQVEIEYLQDVRTEEELAAGISVDTIARSLRADVPKDGITELSIGTPVPGTLRLSLLKGDGTAAFTRIVSVEGGAPSYVISANDVLEFQKAALVPQGTIVRRIVRKAQLVPIGGASPDFKNSLFSVQLIRAADASLFDANGPLSGMGFVPTRTSSVEVDGQLAIPLQALNWSAAQIGVDGRFELVFERPVTNTDADSPPPQETLGWV